MVHSIGSGKMAAIARLLGPGSISQTITEDAGYNKLAAQYTHRELCEANEANLLDEDDMNVFGLKPTTDPLNLVCCNACKKPVRASQFAAHAELCRSFASVEEIVPTFVKEIVPKLNHGTKRKETVPKLNHGTKRKEVVPKLNHGTKRKKPPKKERKKSSKVSAVQPTLTREREPLEGIGSHGSGPSSSHLKGQMQLISSSPNEAKGNAPSVDGLLIMDSSSINAGFVDRTAGAEEPPIKRSKMLAADSQLILDHLGTAKGVTKNMFLNTQEAFTCEYRNGSKIGSGKTFEQAAGNQMPRQVNKCYSPTRGVPAPLATKIYYSQRSARLRSAVNDLYKEVWLQHRPSIVALTPLQNYLLTYQNQIAQMRSFLDLHQLVAEGGGTTAEYEDVISQFWKVDKDVFTKDNRGRHLHSRRLPSTLVALTWRLLVNDIILQQ